MLAGGTALAAADFAVDVKLEAGFYEREKSRAETNLDVALEHLGEHCFHKVNEVRDRDILVHHHTLHLEEGILVAGVGRLVAEAASRENRLDRHAVLGEVLAVLSENRVLCRRGLRFEQLTVLEIVGVLHIARGVVLGNIYRLKALVVGYDLGVILYGEAH